MTREVLGGAAMIGEGGEQDHMIMNIQDFASDDDARTMKRPGIEQ